MASSPAVGVVDVLQREGGGRVVVEVKASGKVPSPFRHDLAYRWLLAEAVLRSDHVEREDEPALVRGRILGDRQLLQRPGRLDRLHCRFGEREMAILDN